MADDWQPVNDWQPVGAPKRSLLDALKEGAGNLIPHSAQFASNLLNLPGNVADAAGQLVASPSRRAQLAAAIQAQAQHAQDVAGGYLQQVRNLSPPEFQGSAAAMSTAAARQAEAGVVRKYGVNPAPQRLAQALGGDLGQPNANAYETAKTAIAEHPLSVLATVASPFAGKLAGPASEAMDNIGNAVSNLSGPISKVGGVLDAGATPAAEAVRSSALAKVMAQQQAGDAAAKAAQAARAADDQLRPVMEAAAQAQAAKGVGVSDMPQAQALVADLKARLNPQGKVVTVPTADQAKAYQSIIDTLSPTEAGQKPSLEMVQNLRRQLAQVAYGGADPAGYMAIGKIARGELVKTLNGIEDAYTGGASAPVRENWTRVVAAQEQADEAEKTRRALVADAAALDELPGPKAVTRAQTIVNAMAKNGLISDDEHRDFLQLANAANDARGKSAFRKRLATTIGASVVGLEGLRLGTHAIGGFAP